MWTLSFNNETTVHFESCLFSRKIQVRHSPFGGRPASGAIVVSISLDTPVSVKRRLTITVQNSMQAIGVCYGRFCPPKASK
jgi:hypothetical protein